jgi:hypothetical protein
LRRHIVDPAIAEFRGRIVKTNGDGMLAEFASAVDAVTCAMSMEEKVAERNRASSGPMLSSALASTSATSSSMQMIFSVSASTWPRGSRMSASRRFSNGENR